MIESPENIDKIGNKTWFKKWTESVETAHLNRSKKLIKRLKTL